MRERVVARHREEHRVARQVLAGDAVDLAADAGIEPEREVDLAAAQQRRGVLGLGHDQRQLDAGVLGAEGGDRQRHQRRGGGLERGQPQAAAAQAGDRLQLGLGLGEPGEDRVGVAHERLAGLGQPDAARVALDERAAGLALERGDLLRDGGLREREGLGGGAERAADRDLAEHAHAADVKHQQNLYHALQKVI